MANCPICQSEYIEETVNFCPTCGWDLTPYPLVLGNIPDAFVEKQKSYRVGAQKIWSRFLVTQERLEQEKATLNQQLAQNRNQRKQLQAKLEEITAQLTKTAEQTSAQQAELVKLAEERVELVGKLAQANAGISRLEQVTQEKTELFVQLAKAKTEISSLQQKFTAQLAEYDTENSRLKSDLVARISQYEADNYRSQRLVQKSDNLAAQLSEANTKISRLQAELDKFKSPKLDIGKQRAFSFEVVTVDSQGRENSRQTKTAQALIQELPAGIIMEMVSIPGGKFWMGSPGTEAERIDHEGPLHEVTVPPFYLGRFTVTQAQWGVIASLPKVVRDIEPNPANFKGNNLPVEQVSWYDTVEFCARLTKHAKLPYRLPSEAEWEYACRAGTNTPFHFGETISPSLVNYDGNYIYGAGKKGKYRKKTVSVGSFQVANAFGLSDMHGNVWEWCSDRWNENYNGAPLYESSWDCSNENHLKDLVDKLSDNDNHSRLLRGGSWYFYPRNCRAAIRLRFQPSYRNYYIGFRVACVAARLP